MPGQSDNKYGDRGGSSQSSSSSRVVDLSVNFGVEQNIVELVVVDALIKNSSVVTFINNNEELNLQSVSFYAKDVVEGVGYTVVGVAPECASGIYGIKALITEV